MYNPRTLSRNGYLHFGVCFGAITWLCYGVVELICIAVLPRIAQPSYEYRAYDAGFSALILAAYAGIGAAAGLASGMVVRNISRLSEAGPGRAFSALHTAALSIVLLANVLILWRNSPFSPIVLVVNLILVIAAASVSLGTGNLARQCRGAASPWLPCVSYALCQWLAERFGGGGSAQRVVLYGVLAIAAVWAISWLAGRAAGAGKPAFPGRMLATVSGLAILCCAVSAALQPGVYTARVVAGTAAERPNVILISLDTVRADHLSVYGYERTTTPHLKEFASESTVFTRAVASSDMTLPSHASMFTGLYASQHGAHFSPERRLGETLDGRFVPLAERLRRKGFWTGGVIANGGYLSVAFGLHHGFEYWDQRLPAIALAPVAPHWLRGRLRDLAVRFVPTSQLDRVSRSAAEINDAVFAALQQRPQDGRAFFLFVNYMDAHIPYLPPAPYDRMFPGKDPGFTESRYMAAYRDVVGRDRQIGGRVRAHLVSQYDGGIAYLDSQLAALFGRLKTAGLYDDSLIIVTADHGESLGERNCLDHGGMSLHDEQIHVPLLIKFPHGHGGAVVEQPVSSVDILPTVLDAVGLPVPKNLPGQSLRSPIPEGREVMSESFPGGRAFYTNPGRFSRTYRSVISASMKYISPSRGTPELYDLRQDPAESRNLYNPQEAESRDMAERLIAWSSAVALRSRVPVKIDRETMERLRSLGYVGQ